MCGRFTRTVAIHQLMDFFPLFDAVNAANESPRYNIAPTQQVAVLRQKLDEPVHGAFMRWGLVPFWAKAKTGSAPLINARADGIATKPTFREPFKKRRCLILADGFYEWRREGKSKIPFHIRRIDRRPFAFAGLWEVWKGEEPPLESCTIITTDANELMKPLHDRMPVILDPRDYERWMDPHPQDPKYLEEFLKPADPEGWETVEVSNRVNFVKNDDADCLTPAEAS